MSPIPAHARNLLTLLGFLFLAMMAGALPARSDANRVGVVATDPAAPAVLNKFEKLNFRIGYSSDRPVRVTAKPFFGGKAMPAMNGGMVTYDAGNGEAYFWISFNDQVKIDRVDVTLMDAATGKPIATDSSALDFSWTGVATGTIRTDADWAQSMQADTQRRAKADAERRAAERSASGGDFRDAVVDVVMGLGGLMVPGYFILQAAFLFRWKDGWRKAAAAPLLPMGLIVVYIFYASVIHGSNIAPIVFVFAAPVAFLYLAVLWLWRRSTLSP